MNGKCANACAPSTIVWMPRARAIRAMSRTGNSCPVRLVMWQMWITFVFGVIARVMRSVSSDRLVVGTGNAIFVTTILSRRTRWSQVSSIRP